MTTYEDVQRGISEDLETHAGMAIQWECLVEGDTSGYAEGIARKSYKAFSKFLLEEHIAHGGKNLPTNASMPVDSEINGNISRMNGILTKYVGSAQETFGRRHDVMKYLNENASVGGVGSLAKALNTFAGLRPKPIDEWGKARKVPNIKYTDRLITPEIAKELVSITNDIKAFSLKYIKECAVLASRQSEVSPTSELSQREASFSPVSRDGSAVQVSPEREGPRERRRSPTPLHEWSLRAARHSVSASPVTAAGAETVSVDRPLKKRSRSETSEENSQADQSNKRREIFAGRSDRDSSGRNI